MRTQVTRRAVIAGAAAAAAVARPAFAHRMHTALSEVTWNPNAGAIEIFHRAYAHDLSGAVARAAGRPGRPLENDEDLALAALYVEGRFAAAADEGAELPLETVGAEFDGDHLYVYQKLLIPEPPQRLGVRNLILVEEFSDQTNFVNVALWDEIRTLIFRGRGGMRWTGA